jgi:dynein heavy chain 2
VWKIEDFLAKWSKATEGKGANDPIAVILMNEIDNYRRCLPYLKGSMRGAGWEDTHWLQVRAIRAKGTLLSLHPIISASSYLCTL